MEGAYPPSFLPPSGCSVLYTVGGIARTEHDSCLHEYVTGEGGRAKKARETERQAGLFRETDLRRKDVSHAMGL